MRIVSDFTIILGPPSLREHLDQVESFAILSHQRPDDVWVYFALAVLNGCLQRDTDGSVSKLDEIVTHALQLPVRVNDATIQFWSLEGYRYPSLVLYPAKVIGPNGKPVLVVWDDRNLLDGIAARFGVQFKTKWVRTIASYV